MIGAIGSRLVNDSGNVALKPQLSYRKGLENLSIIFPYSLKL
ncbi:MAG: hypothetical protein AVDCRST_MAG96-1316 [uncultured Segetibacter sp.]|uniref:Uncharacterized protein n=1 Tax=uncultured Segetibacter sp. TaxID=481133 RepID=A0A6J4SAS0_9BACT|nr:MAG: hypothetical protein AVDCRST_MAG96-1316 [uncultured Segetibacter sp.]